MKGKEKKIAWIQLRTNECASIDLLNIDNIYEQEEGEWLLGFEWAVYTIKGNSYTRVYLADCWKQAKKWCIKEGYDFLDDDPSQELYKSLKLLNK